MHAVATQPVGQPGCALVVATRGGQGLDQFLPVMADWALPSSVELVIVDDRPLSDAAPLPLHFGGPAAAVPVIRTGGRGSAAAWNAGWRATRAPWGAFLSGDTDPAEWPTTAAAMTRAAGDLADLAVQPAGGGPAVVALPGPVGGFGARRSALVAVHGFDERIPAGAEEGQRVAADLVTRLHAAGDDAGRPSGQNRPAGPADTPPWPPPLRAVLFDRDGTLVHDEPYNGDPDLVRPIAGARAVLDNLRARGVKVGVVSNQSGIGRGVLTPAHVDAVNRRIEDELGPFDVWRYCPHVAADGCACRKPGPGLVLSAAEALGIPSYACAVVGDIGADLGAASAAGATGVLVPTPVTRPDEIAEAPLVATDLHGAVTLLLELLGAEDPQGVPA